MAVTIQTIKDELTAIQTSLNQAVADVTTLAGSPTPPPVTPPPVTPPPVIPPPAPTESIEGTIVNATTGSLTDSTGAAWTLVASKSSGNQIAVNGVVDTTTGNVTTLVYHSHQVWQENTANLWWYKGKASDAWSPSGGTSVSPLAAPAPPPVVTPPVTPPAGGGSPVITKVSTPQLCSPGYHSTKGPLIVDSRGVPQRWCFAGWAGMDAEYMPLGLDKTTVKSIVDALKAAGFNGIGLCYDDFYQDSGKLFTYADQIISYCASVGMKVQLRRMAGRYQQSQASKVPYDNSTTYTAAHVQSNLVAVAKRYAGNSTVVGLEIWNEIVSGANLSAWGDTHSGSIDCRALAQTWGNAIQAVNPDIIVVVQGIQTYGVYGNAGGGNNFTDISFVPQFPVTLSAPNKVAYSIHYYPEYTFSGAIDRASINRLAGATRNAGYCVICTETGNPIVSSNGNYANFQATYQDWLDWLDLKSNTHGSAPTAVAPFDPGIGFHVWTVATSAEISASDQMTLFDKWGDSTLNATEMQDVKNHLYTYTS